MLVVTPNLCFDRTLWVEAFEAGTVSRPHRVLASAGGKGVNVARALRCLGAAPELLGLLPAEDGDRFVRLLAEEGQSLRPGRGRRQRPGGHHRRRGLRPRHGLQRARSHGRCRRAGGAARAGRAGRQCRSRVCVVACSGSLPPGLPDDTYGRVVEIVRRHGGTVVVDGARAALAASLPFGPDVVTPNLAEATGDDRRAPRSSRAHEETGLEADRDAAFAGRPRPARAGSPARGRHRRRPRRRLGRRPTAPSGGSPPTRSAWPTPSAPATRSWRAWCGASPWSRPAGTAAVANATAVAGAAVEHEVAGYLDPTRVVELLAASGRVEGAGR